jgi:hypothetical protein
MPEETASIEIFRVTGSMASNTGNEEELLLKD